MKLTFLRKRYGLGEWKTSLKCVDNVKIEDLQASKRFSGNMDHMLNSDLMESINI